MTGRIVSAVTAEVWHPHRRDRPGPHRERGRGALEAHNHNSASASIPFGETRRDPESLPLKFKVWTSLCLPTMFLWLVGEGREKELSGWGGSLTSLTPPGSGQTPSELGGELLNRRRMTFKAAGRRSSPCPQGPHPCPHDSVWFSPQLRSQTQVKG